MLVTIMRGVPGAGKTYWHTHKYKTSDEGRIVVCSANDYFTDPRTGEYRFDGAKLHDAHGACLRRYIEEVVSRNTAAHIIVDNTNIRESEIAPYISIADAYGAPYEIVRVSPAMTVSALAERCIHQVPEDKIRRMSADLLAFPLPRFWNREQVIR